MIKRGREEERVRREENQEIGLERRKIVLRFQISSKKDNVHFTFPKMVASKVAPSKDNVLILLKLLYLTNFLLLLLV